MVRLTLRSNLVKIIAAYVILSLIYKFVLVEKLPNPANTGPNHKTNLDNNNVAENGVLIDIPDMYCYIDPSNQTLWEYYEIYGGCCKCVKTERNSNCDFQWLDLNSIITTKVVDTSQWHPFCTRFVEHPDENYYSDTRCMIPKHSPVMAKYNNNQHNYKDSKQQLAKRIYQTWKTNNKLGPMQYIAMRSWIDKNPDYEYFLFDNEDVKDFILNYKHPLFSPDYSEKLNTVYNILLKEKFSGAAWADFFRLLIIYKYGGVYMDSDTYCVNSLSSWINNRDTMIVNAPPPKLDGNCQWGIIAIHNHPIIRIAIDIVINNFLTLPSDTIKSSLVDYTGPQILVKAGDLFYQTQTIEYNKYKASLRFAPGKHIDPNVFDYHPIWDLNRIDYEGNIQEKVCEVHRELELLGHKHWRKDEKIHKQQANWKRLSDILNKHMKNENKHR